MCLDRRRHKFYAGLAGAAGLLLAILAILVSPRSAILYAQEDDAFTVMPSVATDDPDPAWEPISDTMEDADPAPVLELPQVVAIGPDAGAAGASDPSLSDDPSQDSSDQLGDYAAQRAVVDEALRSAALARGSTMASYALSGGNWAAAAWPSNGVIRPSTPRPILPAAPMLTTGRGARVISGGWWHRAR